MSAVDRVAVGSRGRVPITWEPRTGADDMEPANSLGKQLIVSRRITLK